MEIALIGFRGAGKTTLFNALTGGSQQARTAEERGQPVQGISRVPDLRLEPLVGIYRPKKITPAEMTFWDVPVPDAPEPGAGLFAGLTLNRLQAADALVHVVRGFQDPTSPHAAGAPDAARDVDAMTTELSLSDLIILERRSERLAGLMKGAKGHERTLMQRELDMLQRVRAGLEDGVPLAAQELRDDEAAILHNFQPLTAKPLLRAYNVAEDDLAAPAPGAPVNGASAPGPPPVRLSARLEMEFAQLPPEDEAEFRQSMGVTQSGREALVQGCLRLLNMISFFTGGPKELRAWLVGQDAPATVAAGRVHSDIERGFIRAEVISHPDLTECGSIAQARRRGLLRTEGKSYRVRDGDVITFLFNV